MYFQPIPGVSLKTLIKAMHNSQERSLWDKDVESGEVISYPHPPSKRKPTSRHLRNICPMP